MSNKKKTHSQKVFVDTSGWITYLCEEEDDHKKFAECIRDLKAKEQRFVTSSYVIAELVAMLTNRYARHSREKILGWVNSVKKEAMLEIIYIDRALDTRGWRRLEERRDQKWSLADATSFIIMEDIGMQEVITGDDDFTQAGFTRLPRQKTGRS